MRAYKKRLSINDNGKLTPTQHSMEQIKKKANEEISDDIAREICRGTSRVPGNNTESGVAFYERVKSVAKKHLDLAVSKERERLVEAIEKMKIEKYRGFPLEADEKAVNENCKRIINLINTK